jgi:endoglucanase
VPYATVNGTAAAGSDYRAAAGIVRFAAKETVKTIAIRVRANLVPGDSETFKVKLRRPTNATLDDAEAIGTIRRSI